ncbi:MAG TPA: Crp/Fnr family transcriptional regulator [Nitrolancea sp.]|nr:Crp/Fnr family transcriptional regulator [Nitrolancea sp.]
MATSNDDAANKHTYLSSMEIFQDLAPAEMKHLELVTSMVTSATGRVFFNPAEPAEVLFILKKGEVAISRISPEGKKLIVSTLGPGTIFGEMAIVGQRMHQTFAEALTECVICIMSRRDVEDLLLADPRIAVRLVKALGERLSQAEARLEEMAFKSVPARLASLLVRLTTESDWRGHPLVQGLTQQQLAELVGTYRETVTTILGQFRADGLIEIGRRRIVLLDLKGLRAIAET